jgi:signal transduction histidine kinase
MKHSIKAKLILSYLAVALLTVLVVSVLVRVTSGQSLMNLVVQQETAELRNAVQVYFSEVGSLEGFADYYRFTTITGLDFGMMDHMDRPSMDRDIRLLHGLVDADQVVLIPFANLKVGDTATEEFMKQAIAVQYEGETIAHILPESKYQFALNAEELLFLRRTNMAIGMAALAGIAAAVIIGYLLAGMLIRPIQRLTKASQQLAAGDLQQQVPVTSQDEMGQLTSTFNKMSSDLFNADQKRKRMTADITHDLSTPLQIISGYIEMLEGSEITLSPERIDVIKTEIDHLRRLVGDMTTLTQAESGGLEMQLQPIEPANLIDYVRRTYEPIASQKGIEIKVEVGEGLPMINVDEGRMIQVLKNLMDNALRYTPDCGTIRISAEVTDKVHLRVTDSGNGIEPEDLPYVFDRFYRADKNRTSNAGKMGLGLAICKALVEAQGGSIAVESGGNQTGTTFTISLPPSA